jgi:hypothetical protein
MSEQAPGSSSVRPRYSSAPLPPYSYVAGFAPHPVSDPRGHMHGLPHVRAAALEPESWQASDVYRDAIDLFNHGFYWEAHEAWESLWHAAGRQGVVATWLKLLIKLAAAGVKAREGNAVGVERHARRAFVLLEDLRKLLPAGATRYCGLELPLVERIAKELIEHATEFNLPQPLLLLPQWLPLGET